MQPTYGAQEYQTCTDTARSGYQFTTWSSGASKINFLCPEKFTLGQCRIRTKDISICSRTRYHQRDPFSVENIKYYVDSQGFEVSRSRKVSDLTNCSLNNLNLEKRILLYYHVHEVLYYCALTLHYILSRTFQGSNRKRGSKFRYPCVKEWQQTTNL